MGADAVGSTRAGPPAPQLRFIAVSAAARIPRFARDAERCEQRSGGQTAIDERRRVRVGRVPPVRRKSSLPRQIAARRWPKLWWPRASQRQALGCKQRSLSCALLRKAPPMAATAPGARAAPVRSCLVHGAGSIHQSRVPARPPL